VVTKAEATAPTPYSLIPYINTITVFTVAVWPGFFYDTGHQTSFREEPRAEAHKRTVRFGLGRTEHTEGPRSRTSGLPAVAGNVRVSEATEFQRSGRTRRTGNAAKDIETVQVRIRYCGPAKRPTDICIKILKPTGRPPFIEDNNYTFMIVNVT